MRKPILLAACLIVLFAFQANAQVQKSDQNLGFGFEISSLGGDTGESRLNVFITYTYYLTNNLSLGVGPRYTRTKVSSDLPGGLGDALGITGDIGGSNNVLGYNAFLNYNFLTSGGWLLPYFGAQFTHSFQLSEESDTFSSMSVGGNAGIKFFITERFNVDNNVSFTRVVANSDSNVDPDASVLQVNVGLGYIIGRKN